MTDRKKTASHESGEASHSALEQYERMCDKLGIQPDLSRFNVDLSKPAANCPEPEDKPAADAMVLGNCTTTIPLKLDLHEGEVGHSYIVGPSGMGMSVGSSVGGKRE